MLKQLWNIFATSPILLGSFLIIANTAQATPRSSPQVAQSQTATTISNEPTSSEQPKIISNNQLPQTPEIASTNNSPENTTPESIELLESTATQPSLSQLTPSQPIANLNPTNGILAQQVPTSDSTNTEVLQQIQQYQDNNSGTSDNTLDQVNNVTQLSDVRPTDWAYEALRSLVERYGCIAGYPDGTFRGNRAMSRYEFAAGVNACLQQIERIIQTSTETFVTKQDLETIQRLVDEFRTEITALGGRVDKLEGRVAFLEDHQFSTTTKLRGDAIFAISDLFGDQAAGRRTVPGDRDYANDETVFQSRVRLNFETSFTGKDLLRTRLQASNMTEFGPIRSNPDGNPPGTNITREGRFGFSSDSGNDIALDRLFYRFPLGKLGQAFLLPIGQLEDVVNPLNPGLEANATGAISRFGRYSAIYRTGGLPGAGVGVSIGDKSPIQFDWVYLARTGNNPSEKFGLFDGDFTTLGQVTFKPSDAFRIGATYLHTYDRSNLRHGMGSIASQVQTGRPVVGNSYGIAATFSFTPQLVLSGWGNYIAARAIGLGDADVWTYGATLSLNDFGKKGSTLAFAVGMEPKLTGTSSAALASRITGLQAIDAGRRSDRDTSLHIEGLYKYRLNKNILITPGVIWITAPGHDSRNDDIFIGTVRTTFTF